MTFQVGDLVYRQMYSPVDPAPDSTIEERIKHGRLYGPRRLMRVAGVSENYDKTEYARSMGADLPVKHTTRWWLVDPDRPNDDSKMSWVESDWAVLESAVEDTEMLF